MNKLNILQPNYTAFEKTYQLRIPLETEILIPQNDSVRLLSQLVEEMDLTGLYDTYSRIGKIEVSPRIMTKILIYAYMQGIYSSRGIESACRRDINFWYLLEGHDAPDYSTIARFRTLHFEQCAEDIFVQLVQFLKESGEIDCKSIFIDGTKIEANANRYSFVWKKAVTKYQARLLEKIAGSFDEWTESYGLTTISDGDLSKENLEKVVAELKNICDEEHIEFVNGSGKTKSQLQRDIETAEGYLSKMKEYEEAIDICGQRNSYSKTDHDATFLHMKEDHMRNGQLKPGYNVNVASSEEFIVGNYISADRTDVHTLIPFAEYLKRYGVKNICVDSGYESEENYCWFEENGVMKLYVKPSNHEQRKTKKYRTDISRRENMVYDADADTYICANGKTITFDGIKKNKSQSGFEMETSVYSCKDCAGCPLKEKCIRACGSKKPLAERSKIIYVSKRFARQRAEMEERINTKEGKLIRVNRSIQAEGVFAMVKEDMGFRRFLLRSAVKVEVEWSLLSLAYNVLKLHHKIQTGRLGTGLVVPKGFPAGL